MLKKYTNKHLFTALLLSVWPLQSVQADVIYFDIDATQRYESLASQTVDGEYSSSYTATELAGHQFQSNISFDLFSAINLANTPYVHEFEDNGNTLAWWMTTFNFDPQNIFTLFEDELLGMVDQNAYEWVDAQYQIFAGGTYHYYNPEDDSDVVENITFRKELFGYTIAEVTGGSVQNDFTYWQQFTISLPSPMSFNNRSQFDSAVTQATLTQFSGAGVSFETYITKRNWWQNEDYSQYSFQFEETGYRGYGSYSFASTQAVPAPATISLFVPFLLAGLVAVRRRIVAK